VVVGALCALTARAQSAGVERGRAQPVHFSQTPPPWLQTLGLTPCQGGDGPKRALLEQMVAAEGLAARVTLAGPIPHERARAFLVSPWVCALPHE
jgi:hypothetical protein